MNKNKSQEKGVFKSLPEILLSKSHVKKSSKMQAPKISAKPAHTAPARQLVKNTFQKPKIEIPEDNDNYFVYLKNPLEYRRHLLESSRKILYCLKNYNNLTIIRQRKLEEMKKLKSIVKELIYLNRKFNDKMPKYAIASIEGPDTSKLPTKPVFPKTTKPKKVLDAPKPKTEMDKLEESLASVEKKLQELK